jgi:hypothetical protein
VSQTPTHGSQMMKIIEFQLPQECPVGGMPVTEAVSMSAVFNRRNRGA